MKIIVDANIVFSAILNTNGKIGDLLINPSKQFHFIAPDFLRVEIRAKYQRLIAISKLTLEQIIEAEFQVCRNIDFISEEQIGSKHWVAADKLVHDIDPNDVQYIAYAKHFRCKLWSGDKQLAKGLSKKGFINVISTNELFALRTE